MRLKTLKAGIWNVVAPLEADGTCPLEDQLVELATDRKLRASVLGFAALWSRIPRIGPRGLPTALYHCVDEAHGIYQFTKGPLRLLCFEADGAIVVCSHVLRKQSQKTRSSDKAQAITLRKNFLDARVLGRVQILGEDGA